MVKRFLENFDIDAVLNYIINLEVSILFFFMFFVGGISAGDITLTSNYASDPSLVLFMILVILYIVIDTSYLGGYYYAKHKYKERVKNDWLRILQR